MRKFDSRSADILLSQFFGKGIRVGSGCADVLILDEVDNMMIDNAVKTLYISHSIEDMRYLKDIFLQIWACINGKHASYCQANLDAIESYILDLTKDEGSTAPPEMRIPVPSTLRPFIEHNLRAWIENGYFANFTKADDSYIVGDEESGKQGEVVIMDKDTGVEQNNTKWSKGFHIFLQLKHNAKVSNESLKAVFISNMNYFIK